MSFELPVDAVTQITGVMSQVISDMWPIFALIIGIVLGMGIIGFILTALTGNKVQLYDDDDY